MLKLLCTRYCIPLILLYMPPKLNLVHVTVHFQYSFRPWVPKPVMPTGDFLYFDLDSLDFFPLDCAGDSIARQIHLPFSYLGTTWRIHWIVWRALVPGLLWPISASTMWGMQGWICASRLTLWLFNLACIYYRQSTSSKLSETSSETGSVQSKQANLMRVEALGSSSNLPHNLQTHLRFLKKIETHSSANIRIQIGITSCQW